VYNARHMIHHISDMGASLDEKNLVASIGIIHVDASPTPDQSPTRYTTSLPELNDIS